MNEILRNLARLEEGSTDEPEGIDVLILDAVHLRAFMCALDVTGKSSFRNSFLHEALNVGATYSIVLKIMKLYDRPPDNHEPNTLRKLWNKVAGVDQEAVLITKEFHTQTKNSVFQPLRIFRNKTLAHNESEQCITWEQIDKALFLCMRVWHLVDKHSGSIMMYPFYDFERVLGEFKCLFSGEQISDAKNAWNEYISRIKTAMNESAR